MSSVAPRDAIRLEDLLALNDELAALVRSGVPLERGLSELATDVSGRLSRAALHLSERLRAGQTLSQAVDAEQGYFPPVYRAMVQAGMRAGKLTIVLEALTTSARRLSELRRSMLLALLYPTMVVLIAYVLFIFMLTKVLPAFVFNMNINAPRLVNFFAMLIQTLHIWGPAIPLAVALAAFIWTRRVSRARFLEAHRLPPVLAWLPGARAMINDARIATTSEVLALLLEHQVPLPEALVLAAETSGAPESIAAARRVAAKLEQGANLNGVAAGLEGFPPLMRWLLSVGQNEQMLLALLRHSADVYRGRAIRRSLWLRFVLPSIFTIALGGTATLLYALSLFIPFTTLLEQLSRPFPF